MKKSEKKPKKTNFDPDYEVFPEDKKSKKVKSSYSPYKTGGPQRTKKK